MNEQKPLLMVIAGPMGAGKTTFYDAHLKEAFPTLIPPISHQREAALRERRSFAVEDLVVDTELLESARDTGYTTKVLFISTEDPNLNVWTQPNPNESRREQKRRLVRRWTVSRVIVHLAPSTFPGKFALLAIGCPLNPLVPDVIRRRIGRIAMALLQAGVVVHLCTHVYGGLRWKR